jgi:hypothetical protein
MENEIARLYSMVRDLKEELRSVPEGGPNWSAIKDIGKHLQDQAEAALAQLPAMQRLVNEVQDIHFEAYQAIQHRDWKRLGEKAEELKRLAERTQKAIDEPGAHESLGKEG